jgi:hypothetical protein
MEGLVGRELAGRSRPAGLVGRELAGRSGF